MALIKILYYTTSTGKSPFHTWQKKLDLNTRAIVRTKIDRVRLGNFGSCKQIRHGNGIIEFTLGKKENISSFF